MEFGIQEPYDLARYVQEGVTVVHVCESVERWKKERVATALNVGYRSIKRQKTKNTWKYLLQISK